MIRALAVLLLAAAASAQPPAASTATAVSTAAVTGPALLPVPDSELPRLTESFKGRASLIKAARAAIRFLERLPPERRFDIDGRRYAPAALVDSAREMIEIARGAKTQDELDARVRASFDAFRSAGLDGKGRVVFSSYYQPVLRASLKKAPGYSYPLYRRPPDMVEVDLAAFGKVGDGDAVALGRVGKDKRVTPYPARADIDRRKALAGKGLEVAWLRDPLEVMDLHVQGSGILKLRGGKEILIKYDGTNGRPYNSVGLTLVKTGVFGRDSITYAKMRDYLHANPDAASWILSQNPRYTFFQTASLPPDGEPFGAAEGSLIPARSIAVDPSVVPLGALAFFTTVSPQADKSGRVLGQFPTSRFAFALDTGGAIKGPGRVDIYAGHGAQAEATARGQWADGSLYILVKKLPSRDR
jgi:membrane-bound lytic murein transglycosylase A